MPLRSSWSVEKRGSSLLLLFLHFLVSTSCLLGFVCGEHFSEESENSSDIKTNFCSVPSVGSLFFLGESIFCCFCGKQFQTEEVENGLQGKFFFSCFSVLAFFTAIFFWGRGIFLNFLWKSNLDSRDGNPFSGVLIQAL